MSRDPGPFRNPTTGMGMGMGSIDTAIGSIDTAMAMGGLLLGRRRCAPRPSMPPCVPRQPVCVCLKQVSKLGLAVVWAQAISSTVGYST